MRWVCQIDYRVAASCETVQAAELYRYHDHPYGVIRIRTTHSTPEDGLVPSTEYPVMRGGSHPPRPSPASECVFPSVYFDQCTSRRFTAGRVLNLSDAEMFMLPRRLIPCLSADSWLTPRSHDAWSGVSSTAMETQLSPRVIIYS
jgi:hypothetical protein